MGPKIHVFSFADIYIFFQNGRKSNAGLLELRLPQLAHLLGLDNPEAPAQRPLPLLPTKILRHSQPSHPLPALRHQPPPNCALR